MTNYIFSQKLCYLRGSRFSRCFILALWSNVVFEKGVISHHNKTKQNFLPGAFYSYLKATILYNKGVIFLQLWWPIEFKFSQVCYCMHMLGYTKWEYWSLTITKGVHVFKIWIIGHILNWRKCNTVNRVISWGFIVVMPFKACTDEKTTVSDIIFVLLHIKDTGHLW